MTKGKNTETRQKSERDEKFLQSDWHMFDRIRRFGGIVSAMVSPNISVFIAWGLMAALFMDGGWMPNTRFAELVRPVSLYLIPILIAFMGGKLVDGYAGGVVGSLSVMGMIVGSDIPVFLGAMTVGPLAAWIAGKCRNMLMKRVPAGFEMLAGNFSTGIIGLMLCLASSAWIGPAFRRLNDGIIFCLSGMIQAGFMPLLALINEPAKALFLNNVIDQGVYYPLGMQDALLHGKSILFMVASNPGAGLGLLLAYAFFSQGELKRSAPGAAVIHFLGGIHEMYIPYVLVQPITILGMIAGSASGILVFQATGAGLTAGPSPGSFFAYLMFAPKGDLPGVLFGVAISAGVSFSVNGALLKFAIRKDQEEAYGWNKDADDGTEISEQTHHIVRTADFSGMEEEGWEEIVPARARRDGTANLSEMEEEGWEEIVPARIHSIGSTGISEMEEGWEEIVPAGTRNIGTAEISERPGEPDLIRNPYKIVFACDLGLGTSVMGATEFRRRLEAAGSHAQVVSCAVEKIPKDADVIVTQRSFEGRARLANRHARIIAVRDFLNDPRLRELRQEYKCK